MKIAETEAFQKHHSLRIAYHEGRLSMCEQIRDLTVELLDKHQIDPFKLNNDYEAGKIDAVKAILECCLIFEQAVTTVQDEDIQYDA